MIADNLYVIGIDPGKSGGFAILFGNQSYVSFSAAFEYIRAGERKRCRKSKAAKPKKLYYEELDIVRIAEELGFCGCKIAVIEAVGAMPKQGSASMFNFGKAYGELIGMLKTLQIGIVFVAPGKWKKVLGFPKGAGKEVSVAYVKENYPSVNLIPAGKRVEQDGIAEAICIADAYRKQPLGLGREFSGGSEHDNS